MDESIELLENYGLIRDEDSLRVLEFSKSRIARLHRKLYSVIFNKQATDYFGYDHTQIDPFTFVASKSLRGESDCGEYFCRLQKLDVLGRYAALYANKVILPLPLEHPSKVDCEVEAAKQLARASLALLRLRPLIDAGVIYPVVMRSPECVHTIGWTTRMIEFLHDIALDAAKDLHQDFRVRFQIPEKSPTGLSSVYVEGPKDFLEHGGIVLTFDERNPSWRLKSWRFNKEGMVDIRGDRKIMFLYDILSAIVDDTTFYLAYGKQCNARFLASRSGETFLLNLVTRRDDELVASSEALNAFMTHSLPLLDDLSLGKLLNIRREERDSFVRYRLAVGRILTEVAKKKKRIGKREVRELFREQIEPELTKMKSELYQERRRQLRRIAVGIGGMAASVALGAFGKIFPLAAGGVGATLLGKAAQSTCEHGASLKEKNDFYFLLRLVQEAEAN